MTYTDEDLEVIRRQASAGLEAIETGHAALRAAADVLESGVSGLIAHVVQVRRAYREVYAENQRLAAEIRWLRGQDDPDATAPLPRFSARASRADRARRRGLRRKPPGQPIPAPHSHRKPATEEQRSQR